MARVSDLNSNSGLRKTSRPSVKYDTLFQAQRLDIFVRCSDLSQIDTFSKSDPLCVMFVERLGQWTEYGRTEAISNNVNPRFTESFGLEVCNDEEDMNLKFTVYDLTNFTSQDLRKHDVIGSIELDLKTLLTTNSPFVGTLKYPGDPTARGCIYVYVKKTKDCRSKLRLLVKGSKLSKRGVFGKCDAYFEICRLVGENDEFHPVFRSEVVTRSQDPRWPLAEISLQKLCDNDTETDILFQCWHSIQDGADQLIGEARCTTKSLLEKNHKILSLSTPQKSKRQKSCGSIKILQCHIERQYNLLDFVRGGCNIQFVCAMDFTLSNGDPKDVYSMHSTTSEYNEYLDAFRSFGSILSYYCTDKIFPVFGFGAKLSNTNQVSHHFALNENENYPEIQGFENVIETYLHCVKSLRFSGPTYLTPVFQRILGHHVRLPTQSCQCYTIMLILVDGIVNDLDDFIKEVEKSKQLPLSVVIAGIGPSDFTVMVRDVSGQVCRDIVSYMKVHNIHPNPAQTTNIKPLYETLESTIERRTQPSYQVTSFNNSSCPSCGSNILPAFPVT